LETPSEEKSMNDFAVAVNNIPKLVFSNTLESVDWKSATLAKRDLEEEVLEFQKQSDRDILVGSRSIIIQLMNLNLIDELQLCIHPVIAGEVLPLFEDIYSRSILKLKKTKIVSSGAI